MIEPLRRKEPTPEGALIRMTRNSPSRHYRKGDMAVMVPGMYGDFNNLGNVTVTGRGIHGVAARFYLVVNPEYRKAP